MGYVKQYTGNALDHIAFPLGGLGAGMFCVEGSGCLSNFSLRNAPSLNLEPMIFSAITVKKENSANISRIIEAPVPKHKIFGGLASAVKPNSTPRENCKATGLFGRTYGLPRLQGAAFTSRFPFAKIDFENDNSIPVKISLEAWSPFTPPNEDDSSYPFACLEYSFTNCTAEKVDLVYYFASANFMDTGIMQDEVYRCRNGFVLSQKHDDSRPWEQGGFLAFIEEKNVRVDTALFRGGWFDTLSMLWNDIEAGISQDKVYSEYEGGHAPGACLSLDFSLLPGETQTIRLNCCWFVPSSQLRTGGEEKPEEQASDYYYRPWYAGKFKKIEDLAEFLSQNISRLKKESLRFSDAFYASTVPDIVLEAAGSNLSILKSPTILRQTDGRLWCWEGCCETEGCCEGSCTHVWNYAFALCRLFPRLERGLRETEYFESQDSSGHQQFRTSLPIRKAKHDFYAAADGQLGGIIKTYREFIQCGDLKWLKRIFPKVKESLNYCISTWDKKRQGVLIEPHHNTYDIEFWGADSMSSSYYLAALKAMVEMCGIIGENAEEYSRLFACGYKYIEEHLFQGEYFYQKAEWVGLEAELPEKGAVALSDVISPEAYQMIQTHGPKYQYGTGCLSDGIVGCWLAKLSGLGDILDREKTIKHLLSVYRYNFCHNLSTHVNPQRSGYCLGGEAGLVLCSWPHGGKPELPFVYSSEVWTGVEYQVASHLISMGYAEQGIVLVEACRKRYDGTVRNPFDEYECGHWYARALSSYAVLEAFGGVRYDAYRKTLHIEPQVKGDFQILLVTDGGYGLAGLKAGKPFLNVCKGEIAVEKFEIKKPAKQEER